MAALLLCVVDEAAEVEEEEVEEAAATGDVAPIDELLAAADPEGEVRAEESRGELANICCVLGDVLSGRLGAVDGKDTTGGGSMTPDAPWRLVWGRGVVGMTRGCLIIPTPPICGVNWPAAAAPDGWWWWCCCMVWMLGTCRWLMSSIFRALERSDFLLRL